MYANTFVYLYIHTYIYIYLCIYIFVQIIKAVSSLIPPNVFSANDVRLAQQSEKIIKAVIATNLTHIVEQAKTQELQTRRQRDNHNTRGQAETAIPVDRRKIDQTADPPRLGDGPSRQAKPQARLRHGNAYQNV